MIDGVRAGAKRLGRKPTDKKALRERRPEFEEAQKLAYDPLFYLFIMSR